VINLPAEDIGMLLNTLELLKLKELIGLSDTLSTVLNEVRLGSPKQKQLEESKTVRTIAVLAQIVFSRQLLCFFTLNFNGKNQIQIVFQNH
jgi:hypothetical protein